MVEKQTEKQRTQTLAEQLSEELTCAICIHRLKDPKVLPCLHTFCKECLVDATRGKTQANCPKCRETHPLPEGGVDKLLTNFAVNSLLELLEVHEAEGGQAEDRDAPKKALRCESGLDETDAAARCLDCNIYLCQSCWIMHKKLVVTQRHKTVSLSEIKDAGEKCLHKPQYCAEHVGEVLKLYCKTCSKTICGDCTYVDHCEHKYVFIKNIQDELRTKLQNVLSELKQQEDGLCGALEKLGQLGVEQEADVNFCKKQISQKAAAMRQKIDEEEAMALKAADDILHSRQKEIKAEEDLVSLTLAKVSSNISFMQRLLKSGSDVEVASAAAQAIERSEQLCKLKEKPAPKMKFPTLEYTADQTCNITIKESDINIEVKGINNIAFGLNMLHIVTNVSLRPNVNKLLINPTSGTSKPVDYTISPVKDKDQEWNIEFIIYTGDEIELQISVGRSEFHKTLQIGSGINNGTRVCRGPSWEYGQQDGNGLGTVVPKARTGKDWISVKWDNGYTNVYRWSANSDVVDVVIV